MISPLSGQGRTLALLSLLLICATAFCTAETWEEEFKAYGTVKGVANTRLELSTHITTQGGRTRKNLRLQLNAPEDVSSTILKKKQMKAFYNLCKQAGKETPPAEKFKKLGSARGSSTIIVGTSSQGVLALRCTNTMFGKSTSTVILGKNGHQEFLKMLREMYKTL